MPKLFVPSSEKLLAMIANAEAKFEAGREQARLCQEAHEEARAVRLQVAIEKARRYYRIQHGHDRPTGW